MKKIVKNALSIILTACILMIQAPLFAIGLPESIPIETESNVSVIAEDISKRGAFEKHYLCSDGTFVVVSYAEAVHYKDANGFWVDVDNEVSYNSKTKGYGTRNDSFNVQFASLNDVSNLVTLSSGDHTLSWGLATDISMSLRSSSQMNVVNTMDDLLTAIPTVSLKNSNENNTDSVSLINDAKTFELNKASGGIIYDAFISGSPEISVDYSVFHNKIEEDIYINSRTNIKSISMELSVGELTAYKNFDNSVSFLDSDGEIQYAIGIPYMEDAAGEILNDIDVSVIQRGSYCIVTYTPDEEWFTSDEREYPILLDPSITTREYSSNIVDTYVYEGNTANHSSEKKNIVGIKDSKINRTFIKITNLPAIHDSMPIIEATLTLTMTSGSTTGRTVGLYKLNKDWNPSTLTYANQSTVTVADRIDTCAFSATSGKFTFDLTDDISRLYSDFVAGLNYGYVMKYESESKTNPDYNATHSMEQTTVSYRPLLKIVYGYSLPSGLKAGGVYALQNRGTNSFLTVHNGTDADDVNVYQKNTAAASLGTNQKFKLEYVSATGAYRFRAMCSSDANGRVLDIVKSGGYVNNGGNVQIYKPTDELANEWFIIGTGISTFRIVPRTNMALSLTVYPGGNGTSSGTTSTSVGNVFVSTTNESSNYQQWIIRDIATNSNVSAGGTPGPVSNGTYYINNKDSGKYLYNSGAVEYVDGVSGLISQYEDQIRWIVTFIKDGAYTIQLMDDPTKYISGASTGRVTLDTLSGETNISNNHLWKITAANGGGVKIQSVATGGYLYLVTASSTTSLNLTLPSVSSGSYNKYVWRMVNANTYGNTSEYSARELTSGFAVDPLVVEVGYTDAPSIKNINEDAIWVSDNDFTYSISSPSILEYNSSLGRLVAKSTGQVTVTLRHKVTNLTAQFSANVNPLLIYRSRNREVYGFEDEDDVIPGTDEDLQCGQKTINQLLSTGYIEYSDLYTQYNTVQLSVNDRMQIIEAFCNSNVGNTSGLLDVLEDMFAHFLDGTGTDFSDVTLTNAVVEHQNTTKYVNAIIELINDYLLENDGDIYSLYYDEDLWTQIVERESHPMVNMMIEAVENDNNTDVHQPSYGYNNGLPGLAMCLNGLYGNKFEIESYTLTQSGYSGTIKFRFYDHFGLDTLDLTANKLDSIDGIPAGSLSAGAVPAFRQWYILQHWDDLDATVQPKPFVTIIEFSVPFSGVFN